jgi:hypothetical protein
VPRRINKRLQHVMLGEAWHQYLLGRSLDSQLRYCKLDDLSYNGRATGLMPIINSCYSVSIDISCPFDLVHSHH